MSIFNPDMTQSTGESVNLSLWGSAEGKIKSLLGGFRPQLLIKNTDIPWEEKKRVLTESCWSSTTEEEEEGKQSAAGKIEPFKL